AGYARVDLRLDERGAPHVLEVNANPCLAAHAGFLAAAERAGLTRADVVARILAAAVARHECLAPATGGVDGVKSAAGQGKLPVPAEIALAGGRIASPRPRRLRAVS